MILEFRLKNFKSFRDEAIFSFTASKDKALKDSNLLATGIKSLPHVVCSAAIYGPNAGGKSNLMGGLKYLRDVVIESASLPVDQAYNIKPFALDPLTKEQPTEFEITFLMDGVRYQYGFAMTPVRIIEEWLLVYKTAKPQSWFHRHYDEDKQQDHYEFGAGLTGQKQLWKKATRGNALFLSIATQLNSEQLTPIYLWITQNIVVFGVQGMPANDYSIRMIEDENSKQEMIQFLASADISIEDMSVTRKKGFKHSIQLTPATGKTETHIEDAEIPMPRFHHQSAQGNAVFELHEESLGTQRLFTLAWPILSILKEGKCLIFDELDSSLHSTLAKKIVELFHDPDVNKHGAQLLFSTHDTALLHSNLLRRDQVWFVEKDAEQVSQLYPLTDFSPRKKESIQRGYLMGRYGAVPFFQDTHLNVNT